METAGHRLILLPNVSYPGKLPIPHGEYIYDLSDASLLQNPNVVNVIRQCAYVTVATKEMEDLVKPFANKVQYLPSTIHAEWLKWAAKPQPPDRPTIACIGNFAWELITEPLLAAMKEFPQVCVVTSDAQLFERLPEKRRWFYNVDVQFYSQVMRRCFLGIVPGEHRHLDPGIIYEYGLFGIPVIAGPAWRQEVSDGDSGFIASSPEQFVSRFRKIMADDHRVSGMGSAAFAVARKHTAVRLADDWLRAIQKLCPTGISTTTLK
jgi:hypothetical protein